MKHMKAKRITTYLLTLAMFMCMTGCKQEEEKSKAKRPDLDTLRAAEVGSYIYFGEYEQDNDASTGKEAIEWLVLDKQDDKMLVISRYGLDCQPYNTENEDVTWETCSLRAWLNNDFYEAAFIPEEKNVILTSVVTADANPRYDTPVGNDTTDQVFLLSIEETERYFADDNARKSAGTPYCYEQGASKTSILETCYWLLRSPGRDTHYAAVVRSDGGIIMNGVRIKNGKNAVRPALWIDLSNGEKPNTEPIAAASSTLAAKKES